LKQLQAQPGLSLLRQDDTEDRPTACRSEPLRIISQTNPLVGSIGVLAFTTVMTVVHQCRALFGMLDGSPSWSENG
jgi:hypothetical protein